MTNVVFWPDVSHYQVKVNDQFTGQFLMYKVSESTNYVDPNAAANGSWCHANSGPGKKMVGYGGYHVWSPGSEQTQANLFFANVPLSSYLVAMIDVESWGGEYSGDHSSSITALANLFAAKLGQRRVKVYANSGDLAQLYPTRPSWLGIIKADYSSTAPPEPWVGWQYTDGSTTWPVPSGWPRSSAPFGNCDHNAYYGTVQQFATEYGIASTKTS
jgi:GH25 family lysozyme M1 (1,4-beta-N-acetylmuramidase)